MLPEIKTLFRERKEVTVNGDDDYDLLAVSEYYGVARKADVIKSDEFLTRAKSLTGYKVCRINDFAMNIMLAWKKAYGISSYNGIVSPSYAVFEPTMKYCTQYYHYLYRTTLYSGLFKSNSTGIIDSRLRLYPDVFLSLSSHYPPLPTQTRIAEYLDRKVALIDSIIEKTKQTIEEYKAYKQSLITEVVTKGLNKDAKMKDSGIEWIGEIPEGWEVRRTKYLSPVLRGASPRPIQSEKYFDVNGSYVWTRIADVSKCTKYFDKDSEYMSELGESKSVKLEPGELFLSICATVGKPIITKVKCCIHDGFVYFPLLKPKYVDLLFYIFENGSCFGGLGKMGTQLNLNTETVGGIHLPIPEDNELGRIINRCERISIDILEIIEKKMRFITELESYKKSLIYEVVTGKKEV